MERYKIEADLIRENARHEPIKVLVWGPGDPGANVSATNRRAYDKRIQIRDILRNTFPRAEVYFSEDEEMNKISSWVIGDLRKEALHALTADFIIMLDISRGVDLELDHFIPTYPWFRDKVHVFLPERYVPPSGLVTEVFDLLKPDQIEGFSYYEFRICSVATKKAVRATLSAAMALYATRIAKR